MMEVIMNNGLGFASFVALLYLYQYILKDLKDTNEEILKTLIAMQNNLNLVNQRIERIERLESVIK